MLQSMSGEIPDPIRAVEQFLSQSQVETFLKLGFGATIVIGGLLIVLNRVNSRNTRATYDPRRPEQIVDDVIQAGDTMQQIRDMQAARELGGDAERARARQAEIIEAANRLEIEEQRRRQQNGPQGSQ